MEKTTWLIWSIEHNAWWAPECRGYVEDRDSAGVYGYEQALKIVAGANYNLSAPIVSKKFNKKLHTPNEAMIKYGDVV